MAKGKKGTPEKLQQILWKRQREYRKILQNDALRIEVYRRITGG